jgi:hypothetical protein
MHACTALCAVTILFWCLLYSLFPFITSLMRNTGFYY